MLHAVIGLYKVHEGCKQRLLLKSGPVNEVAQSKQLMLCGHARPETCLARGSQASFFSPADNAAVEDGSKQSAERLSHCNRPIVGGVALVPFFEDRGNSQGFRSVCTVIQAEHQSKIFGLLYRQKVSASMRATDISHSAPRLALPSGSEQGFGRLQISQLSDFDGSATTL